MSQPTAKLVVFTDLDGTMLDPVTYAYDEVLPALNALAAGGVPVVFCSHKTRAEQEVYRLKLGVRDPFIVENGGAVFVPCGYFPVDFDYDRQEGGYRVIELGIPYADIRRALEKIRSETGVDLCGFGDMTAAEVAADAGLSVEAAGLAKQREYDETVIPLADEADMKAVLAAIKRVGLNYTHGGRYYGVMGDNDKGRAVGILTGLFRCGVEELETVGIGDSQNDAPMLKAVDRPFLVQRPGGRWEDIDVPNLKRVEGVGPLGWVKVIEGLLGGG